MINLWQTFLQSSRHFSYALFGTILSSSSDAAFIFLSVAKFCPFMGLFSLGSREKFQWHREYYGRDMIPFLHSNFLQCINVSISCWSAGTFRAATHNDIANFCGRCAFKVCRKKLAMTNILVIHRVTVVWNWVERTWQNDIHTL